MGKDISNELIRKYLAGDCSPTEKRIVDEWYAGFEQSADLISDLTENQQHQVKLNLLNKIKRNIREAEAQPAEAPETFQLPLIEMPRTLAYYAARVAAVFALVLGLGMLAVNYWAPEESGNALAAQREVSNQEKLVKKIILQDGSKVWLQQNSSLVIADDFGRGKRKVSLTGEAFFEVARDENRPFEISTGQVITRVLGTSFNIKAFEKGNTVEVAVVTGKVSVRRREGEKAGARSPARAAQEKAGVILRPNQQVTYTKSAGDLVKKEVPAGNRRMVWAKTSLSFENTPIREAVKILNENFDTDIKLASDNFNNCSINGDFANQNLPEILEVICKSIEAEYQLYKEEIVITGEGCPMNSTAP